MSRTRWTCPPPATKGSTPIDPVPSLERARTVELARVCPAAKLIVLVVGAGRPPGKRAMLPTLVGLTTVTVSATDLAEAGISQAPPSWIWVAAPDWRTASSRESKIRQG